MNGLLLRLSWMTPSYLEMPYVTTSHFRREADNSKWNPSPCETWAPPEGAVPIKF